MLHRASVTVVACAISLLFLGSLAAQDDSKEAAENAAEAKAKIALLLAKSQIVQAINEKEATAAKLSTKGRSLVERKYDLVISELRQKFGLDNWSPSENDELIATRNGAVEFLEALADARDNVRRKAKKKTTSNTTGPAVTVAGVNPFANDVSPAELNKWRGDVVRQGEAFCQNLQNTGEEKDIRSAWKSIQDHVVEVFDRLHPILLADAHVRAFHQEGLLESWNRIEGHEDLSVRVSGFNKVQMVSYKIVDAYGTPRKGSVAVGLLGTGAWEVLRENNVKGGFYELTKADP
jgi:hypothetical protein